MTWQQQLEKTAQHYADLARDPAWKAYAKARVLEPHDRVRQVGAVCLGQLPPAGSKGNAGCVTT